MSFMGCLECDTLKGCDQLNKEEIKNFMEVRKIMRGKDKWLAIEGLERDALIEKNIPFVEVEIRRPSRFRGLAIPSDARFDCIELLGFDPEAIRLEETETELQNVVLAKIINVEEENRRMQRARENYINLVSSRIGTRVDQTRQRAEEIQQAISEAMTMITEKVREQTIVNKELAWLEQNVQEVQEGLAAEFQKLMDIPEVDEINCMRRKLVVKLNDIVIEFNGRRYLLGRPIIEIHQNGTIKISNPGNTVSRKPHPHVNSEGDPCLGNISEGIAKLIGQFEFATAVQILIEFLKNFNEGEQYRGAHITNWPRA